MRQALLPGTSDIYDPAEDFIGKFRLKLSTLKGKEEVGRKRVDRHQYQILTKRSKRLQEFGSYYGKFPDNVWIGVSVENMVYKTRIEDLKKSICKNSFS
jgi:protein gp37